MKRKIVSLAVGFMLIGINLFAADGDLIVNGSVGIGTPSFSPETRLEVRTSASEPRIKVRTTATHGNTYFVVENDPRRYLMEIAGWSNDSWVLWDETAGAPRITVTPGGNVGIGTTNPSNLLTMETSGGGYYSQTTHAWVNGSSGRWKSSIKPIVGALDTVLKLNGVSFKWKKRTDIFQEGVGGTKLYVSSSWEDDPNGRDDIGLIGEGVMEVLPEVVDVNQKDSNFVTGIDYSKVVAVLIEAIKEQQKEIVMLKEGLEAIKK